MLVFLTIRVGYWVNKGVLTEAVGEGQGGSRVFVVCEEQAALAAGDHFTDREDAEADMVSIVSTQFDIIITVTAVLVVVYLKSVVVVVKLKEKHDKKT